MPRKPKLKKFWDSEHPALKRGADELANLIEYHFKDDAKRLFSFRAAYVRLCLRFYNALEKRFLAACTREGRK